MALRRVAKVEILWYGSDDKDQDLNALQRCLDMSKDLQGHEATALSMSDPITMDRPERCGLVDPDPDPEPPEPDDRAKCRLCGCPISDVEHDDNDKLCGICADREVYEFQDDRHHEQ